MWKIIVALAMVAVSVGATGNGKAVKFKNCKSSFQIKRIVVTPCENPRTNKWCPLVRGTRHSISVTFVPNRNVERLNAVIKAKVGGVDFPFNLETPNACDRLSCPLQQGQEYTYTESIQIRSEYPKTKLLVTWSLSDPDKDPSIKTSEICFIMLAKVSDRADVDAMNSRL